MKQIPAPAGLRLALATERTTSKRFQVDVAREAGIDESRMSRIVNGRVQARDEEMLALSRVLRRPVYKLFGKEVRNAVDQGQTASH